MAYSPVEQGRLLDRRALIEIAERHTASPAQVALAWLLHRDGVLPIPKAGTVEHVRENRAAADLVLTPDDLTDLDRRFLKPTRRRPLEML
jgi:diketogulonate reductase-like aldo/keto reductase